MSALSPSQATSKFIHVYAGRTQCSLLTTYAVRRRGAICVPCLNASTRCYYETQYPDESRLQAKRREHENLQASQKAARDSIDWLRSQSPNDAIWYLQQLRSSQDPLQDLCSMATTERAQYLPPQISSQDIMPGSSKLMRDTLTAELTFRYPATFPWISETDHALLPGVEPDLVTSLQWKSPQSS